VPVVNSPGLAAIKRVYSGPCLCLFPTAPGLHPPDGPGVFPQSPSSKSLPRRSRASDPPWRASPETAEGPLCRFAPRTSGFSAPACPCLPAGRGRQASALSLARHHCGFEKALPECRALTPDRGAKPITFAFARAFSFLQLRQRLAFGPGGEYCAGHLLEVRIAASRQRRRSDKGRSTTLFQSGRSLSLQHSGATPGAKLHVSARSECSRRVTATWENASQRIGRR
jgi:hypothetical protein